MKIRFGKSTIDGSDAPIAIFLTAEEKRNLMHMPDGTAILCDYPKEKYTEKEINKWLGVKDVVKTDEPEADPRWKRQAGICCECGNKVWEGDAVAVSKDGYFIHSDCGLDKRRIGTMKGGKVRMF